jgi:hypothetical protein
VWQLISDNLFSHRKRKVQDEDDIMVCQCPPPWRGGDGCGPNCLNRMLCIECTDDFCPCENHCTNQTFTRKQYAKLAVVSPTAAAALAARRRDCACVLRSGGLGADVDGHCGHVQGGSSRAAAAICLASLTSQLAIANVRACGHPGPAATCPQRRAGPKGFGLWAEQDIKAGQFIIEYIGEVRALGAAAASRGTV